MAKLKLLLLICLNIVINARETLQQTSAPIINLSYGSIRGTLLQTETFDETYAYLGIPYVHPPINELRFKPPKPIDANSGRLYN